MSDCYSPFKLYVPEYAMLGGRRNGVLAVRLAVRAALSATAVDLGSPSLFSQVKPLKRGKQQNAITAHDQASSSLKQVCLSNKETPPPTAKECQVHYSTCGFAKSSAGMPSTVLACTSYGEDACFTCTYGDISVFGVADGVGGWNRYGIDPALFSMTLMRECERVVVKGNYFPREPKTILQAAFASMQKNPQPIGSSTACVLVVLDQTLYSANLGDSGFVVVRGGKVIARSVEQVHYFNAPFQLCIPPQGWTGSFNDSPNDADQFMMKLEKGDIVILATDGFWDNVPDDAFLSELSKLQTPELINPVCFSLALTARKLSGDSNYMSPFAKKALAEGQVYMPGGKPDDVTVILLLIA